MGFKRTWAALGGLCAEVHLVVKMALQCHPVLSLSEPSIPGSQKTEGKQRRWAAQPWLGKAAKQLVL